MSLQSSAYLNMSTPRFINHGHREFGIPVSNIKPLIKLLVSQGVPLDALLKNTNIPLEAFCQLSSTIIFPQYLSLIANARRLNNDATYALRLGEQFFINHDGMLACRVMSSDNTQAAMELLSQYQNLFTQILTLSFEVKDNIGIFRVEEKIPLGDALPHFIEYTFAALFHLGKFCLGKQHIDVTFNFSYANPTAPYTFSNYFNNQVFFNCEYNQVLIPLSTLKSASIFSNPQAAQENEQLCSQHLFQTQSQEEIIGKVKKIIRHMPFTSISLESLSEQLHMSPRTLRRHLQGQGVSYKTLLENERKRLALKHMQDLDSSIEATAEQLGYQNASSFSRAFKRWFGQSPIHYKQQSTLKAG